MLFEQGSNMIGRFEKLFLPNHKRYAPKFDPLTLKVKPLQSRKICHENEGDGTGLLITLPEESMVKPGSQT